MAHRVQSCMDANGGHFQHTLWCRHVLHNEVSPLQISLHILINGKIIKEMPGSVASGTLCILCSVFSILTRRFRFRFSAVPQICQLVPAESDVLTVLWDEFFYQPFRSKSVFCVISHRVTTAST
jgi:hypothetical protein